MKVFIANETREKERKSATCEGQSKISEQKI